MDAVKFVEERRRMFAVTGTNPKYSLFNMSTCAEDVVKEVAEWSAEHPHKTRQDVFLEQWPNAEVFVDGVLQFCPQDLDSKWPCQSTDVEMRCQSCRRKFWVQEVE